VIEPTRRSINPSALIGSNGKKQAKICLAKLRNDSGFGGTEPVVVAAMS
jgi:hypothetical protein